MRYLPFIVLLIGLLVGVALEGYLVDDIEYWFDTDPGQGNGSAILHRDTVDIGYIINAASLSPGIHRLYIRSRNDQGDWGLPKSAAFLVPPSVPAVETRTVAGIEYWFDTDPGQGEGIHIYDRDLVELDQLIGVEALSHGVHRLYVRSQNDLGEWGLPQSRAFFVTQSGAEVLPNSIAAIEYFFDADPGLGEGIQVYGRNLVELDQLISSSGLEPGIHRLYVRARNQDGDWGMPQTASLLILTDIPAPAQVTCLEYFIDHDPGMGNGTPVSFNPGSSVDISVPVTPGAVEHGNHSLYFRGRSDEGGWGFPVCVQFSDGIPAHLSIIFSAGSVILSWEDLYGIDTYNVYSSALPASAFSLDESGSFGASTWTAPVSGSPRFYRVTSIYDE